MGSLIFDDLRVFFSLLSLPIKADTGLEVSSIVEGISDVLNPSIFTSILVSSVPTAEIPQIVFSQVSASSSDSLIEWCYLNCGSLASLTFFNEFEVTNLNTSFLISVLPSSLIIDKGLSFDLTSFCQEIHFVNSLGSLDLLANLDISGNLQTKENLLLFKQICEFYFNSSSSILAQVDSSMLNLNFVSIGFFLICVSLFIKLSIAPFHFWSLDVYEGSPNTTTFFFAVVPKISLFVLLMRLCYVSFYQIFIEDFQVYFFALAVLSVFVGSLGGLEQRKLKTLLAYSSISHTGYLLLSFSTCNIEGLQMMFYYLSIYMISGLTFWAVYLFLINKSDIYFNKNNKELGDLVLLKESNPNVSAYFNNDIVFDCWYSSFSRVSYKTRSFFRCG